MRISDWSSDVCSSDLIKVTSGGNNSLPVISITVHEGPISSFVKLDFLLIQEVKSSSLAIKVRNNGNVALISSKRKTCETTLEQIGRASCRERVCKYV